MRLIRVVVHEDGRFRASPGDHSETSGYGKNASEAIGNLVWFNPNLFETAVLVVDGFCECGTEVVAQIALRESEIRHEPLAVCPACGLPIRPSSESENLEDPGVPLTD